MEEGVLAIALGRLQSLEIVVPGLAREKRRVHRHDRPLRSPRSERPRQTLAVLCQTIPLLGGSLILLIENVGSDERTLPTRSVDSLRRLPLQLAGEIEKDTQGILRILHLLFAEGGNNTIRPCWGLGSGLGFALLGRCGLRAVLVLLFRQLPFVLGLVLGHCSPVLSTSKDCPSSGH